MLGIACCWLGLLNIKERGMAIEGREGGGTKPAINSGKGMCRNTAPTSKAREALVGKIIMPPPESLSGMFHGVIATYERIKRRNK